MPWCAECDRYLAPPAVATDGTCPSCGRPVEVSERAREGAEAPREPAPELQPVPWHFKLVLAAFALYLGFRAFQLLELFF